MAADDLVIRNGTIVDGSPPAVFEWDATVEHDGIRLRIRGGCIGA